MSHLASLLTYAGLALAVGLGILGLSWLVGPRRDSMGKFEPYECGVPLLDTSRDRITIRFYLVAILFILFDIETVFLVPWAVMYRELGLPGLVDMLAFLGVLGIGLFYVWRRRALEWD